MNFGEEVVRIQDISFKTDKKKAKSGKPQGEDASGAAGGDKQTEGESSAENSESSEGGSSEGDGNSGGGFGF
jgi:hypothetical protein